MTLSTAESPDTLSGTTNPSRQHPIPDQHYLNLEEDMTKKLSDYTDELNEFEQAQDFVLGGVWESLDHAPTFVLDDGSRLRPLTAKILLRRSPPEDGDLFEIVGYAHVCNEFVITREPEPTRRTTSS